MSTEKENTSSAEEIMLFFDNIPAVYVDDLTSIANRYKGTAFPSLCSISTLLGLLYSHDMDSVKKLDEYASKLAKDKLNNRQ